MASVGWKEGFVERCRGVGVEIVHHQHDLLGLGTMHIDQLLYVTGEVDADASLTDHDVSPAAERLGEQKGVAHAAPYVLVVLTRRLAGRHRIGRRNVSQKSWRLVSSRHT